MTSKLLAHHHIHSQMFLRINLSTGEGILHIPVSGDCSDLSNGTETMLITTLFGLLAQASC